MKTHCARELTPLCPEHSHQHHSPEETPPPPHYYIQLHTQTSQSNDEQSQTCRPISAFEYDWQLSTYWAGKRSLTFHLSLRVDEYKCDRHKLQTKFISHNSWPAKWRGVELRPWVSRQLIFSVDANFWTRAKFPFLAASNNAASPTKIWTFFYVIVFIQDLPDNMTTRILLPFLIISHRAPSI